MPDALTGSLSEDDKRKFMGWLGRYQHRLPACPYCANETWVVGDHLVQPITLGGGLELSLGGLGYPQVMLISVPCGHTVFFNAVMAGLVPATPPISRTPIPPVGLPPQSNTR